MSEPIIKSGFEITAENYEKKSFNQLRIAETYVIESQIMAEAAAGDACAIAALAKEIEEMRDGLVRPYNQHVKSINDKFRPAKETCDKALKVLRNSISAWNAKEQARIAHEAAIQRKAIEDERIRLEEVAKAAQAEMEKAAAEGNQEAVEQAQTEAIQAVEMAETVAMHAPVQTAPQKLSGVSQRYEFKAEVTDKMALIQAVAKGEASPDLLDVATKVINQRVKALKSEFVCPGIRVYKEPVVSFRSK